jgi:hypothetical protein
MPGLKWYSAFLASVRPLVQTPVPPKANKQTNKTLKQKIG